MNYLERLVDFEKNSVKKISTSGNQLLLDFVITKNLPLSNRQILGVNIVLSINNLKIIAKMDRIFIHQIGKRIYGNIYENDYPPVFHNWLIDFNKDVNNFKQVILETIIKNNLIIKYYSRGNLNFFYGFVSPIFEETNHLEFRNLFHECANKTDKISTASFEQYELNNINKTVKEYYKFKTGNDIIHLSCGIVYGINNGYGAYSVHWLRKYNTEHIWLATWKSEIEFKWRNNPSLHNDTAKKEMERFVELIIEEGYNLSEYTMQKITTAQSTKLDNKKLKDFYDLFQVAKATLNRVNNVLNHLVIKKGNTNMSFIESICYVGTFDKHTTKAVKRLLIETGTRLLDDEGFDIILKNNKEIVLTGDYEWY